MDAVKVKVKDTAFYTEPLKRYEIVGNGGDILSSSLHTFL